LKTDRTVDMLAILDRRRGMNHPITCNRQWLLKTRPVGALTLDNFAYREQEYTAPQPQPGEVLVRNVVFNCAPTMRNWMNDAERSYRAPMTLDAPVVGPACARVLRSAHPRFTEGTLLVGVSRWEDYSVLTPDASAIPMLPVPSGVSPSDAVGVFGLNSLTAYFGLLRVGEPKPAETLVVSGASGSVGSMAVQIGKIIGCRVIGIAGGREKCAWLSDIAALDHVIDYKTDDVAQRLRELAPTGVDVFFDNVGGPLLQILVDRMAVHGRIVLCGQVSAYDGDRPAAGPRDMMQVVYKRLRLQGFVTGDFIAEADLARGELMRWVEEGKVVRHEDLREGFARLPHAFLDLFTGAHRGTLLVLNREPLDRQ
jgi:NADPH-dependent curcumin reductase CurA